MRTICALLLLALVRAPIAAQEQRPLASQEASVSADTATGTFEVKLTPQPTEAAPIGRWSLDKHFQGDLAGTSTGEMLGFWSDVEGSGAYVALERFTGTLKGRKGSFVLQHRGTMTRGTQHLELTVAPDSGTDELVGITGSMEIIIEGGTHRYVLTYRVEVEGEGEGG